MESSPAATAAAAAMPETPASSSRSRDPRLFGGFDLPAAWGCRRPMAFCKDLEPLVSESNAAAAAGGGGGGGDGEPKRKTSRSPAKGVEAQHASPAGKAAAVAAVAAAAQEAPRRQWELRERRAGRDSAEDAQQHKKLRNMDAGGSGFGFGGAGAGKKSRGFSVELTRQEIESDFLAITGHKPRKTRRRPKSVQRQIDTLCPGSSLWEVSRDRYKVNEKGGF